MPQDGWLLLSRGIDVESRSEMLAKFTWTFLVVLKHSTRAFKGNNTLSIVSIMASRIFSSLLRLPTTSRTYLGALLSSNPVYSLPFSRSFSSTTSPQATFNQVLRGCRVEQRARKARSPALVNRPELKGVCLRVGVVKPKKPNSGERKVARLRLSSGKLVTAYIPGEGKGWTI